MTEKKKAPAKKATKQGTEHKVKGYGIIGPLTADDIKSIRMCIDVYPQDEKHVIECAARAVKENPQNRPVGVYRASPLEMALITGKKWQSGRTLTIGFLDGNPQNMQLVKQHAPYWQNFCGIKFQFVESPAQADVRISFRQSGAWSYIGTDVLGIPKNQPTMNFGFIDPTTIKHEFGHTLGCIHEHQHPLANIPWNTQAVYQYFSGPPNSWSRAMIDSNIFQKYSQSITQFGAYDPRSIMHYPFDGKLLTDPSKAVGFNTDLSVVDKQYIGQIYPKSGPVTPTDPVTPPDPTDPPTVAISVPVMGKYTLQKIGNKLTLVFENG